MEREGGKRVGRREGFRGKERRREKGKSKLQITAAQLLWKFKVYQDLQGLASLSIFIPSHCFLFYPTLAKKASC